MLVHPRALALAALVLAGGCISARGYPCDDDDACVLAGERGHCEAEGWCSYPDGECGSGRRFEARAGDDLASTCTEQAIATGDGTGSSTGGESSTTEGPSWICSERPCAVESLVVGDLHTCVTDENATLWCWGGNADAQLGRGTRSGAERCPAPAFDLGPVSAAAAAEHMCALDEGSRVHCWGLNANDQVDWRTGAGDVVVAPVELDGLPASPTALDVGPTLSCAASGSTVACWGVVGVDGELPVEFDAGAVLSAVAVGSRHACGITDGGAVVCQGEDALEQLGNGPGSSPGLAQSMPIDADAQLVDAGHHHTCAVIANEFGQTVLCWGDNSSLQCGSPMDEVTEVAEPTSVSGLVGETYTDLALGARHSCVLAGDGRVQCWGDNADGQVAPGAPSGYQANLVTLEDDAPLLASEIGAGDRHTCARTIDGRVVCWGANDRLQLGADSSDATATHHFIEIGCD